MTKRENDPSTSPLTLREAPIVIIGARGFRKCAQPFIEKMVASYNPQKPDGAWDCNPGECIASATNLALAVELYLKGLTLYVHQVPCHTHDLLDLYNVLPAQLRADLEALFNAIPMPPTVPGSLRVSVAWAGRETAEEEQVQVKGEKLDLSLPGILERERGAFIDWRYFFEKPRPDRPVTVFYPFGRLASIADVLDATAVRADREVAADLARIKEEKSVKTRGDDLKS